MEDAPTGAPTPPQAHGHRAGSHRGGGAPASPAGAPGGLPGGAHRAPAGVAPRVEPELPRPPWPPWTRTRPGPSRPRRAPRPAVPAPDDLEGDEDARRAEGAPR
ncbi:MAG: hypothetical protein R3F43_06300 [bacterium]